MIIHMWRYVVYMHLSLVFRVEVPGPPRIKSYLKTTLSTNFIKFPFFEDAGSLWSLSSARSTVQVSGVCIHSRKLIPSGAHTY